MDLSKPLQTIFDKLEAFRQLVDTLPEPERQAFYEPLASISLYAGVIAASVGYDMTADIKGEIEMPIDLDLSEPLRRIFISQQSVTSLLNASLCRPDSHARRQTDEHWCLMTDHNDAIFHAVKEIAQNVDYDESDYDDESENDEVFSPHGVIVDQSGTDDKIKLTVSIMKHGMIVYAEGYGDKCSEAPHGSPLVVELYEGKLRAIIWSDINQEDPTHIIDLSGAMESKRVKEET